MNDCRTKCRNVKLSRFFVELRRIFSYLINMTRLLGFFGVSIFFKVFSLKLECVLKLFLNIEGLILSYHAVARKCSVKFCKIHKKIPMRGSLSWKHVLATLLKKDLSTGVFFCEFTKFDRIPLLYNTFLWLHLFTRVSVEKVTNYLSDHAEYEYNSDQRQWNTGAHCCK